MAITVQGITKQLSKCSNVKMDTKEIRLTKLRQIISDKFGGIAGRCADALEMKRPQVSRWVTKNNQARQGISDDSAREIERKLGYERGWMDGLSSYRANQIESSKVTEPDSDPYIAIPMPKTKRELRIEAIHAWLERTDEDGLLILLHEAEKTAGKFPLAKQTRASSQ